jgi:putative phosphoribosyl transferase
VGISRKAGNVAFHNRSHAGRELARLLSHYADCPDVIVLGLPRGGVPVAFEVAQALNAPLDVFLVRKLGVPGHEELAMGAIASGGVRVVNPEAVHHLRISDEVIEDVARAEERELRRRERLYRDDRPRPQIQDQIVVLVDDGLATGSTMKAAAEALRRQSPARIVVAVPVAAAETCREFEAYVDEIVCVDTPSPFYAVGMWYEDFSQTSEEEVQRLLDEASSNRAVGSA